MGCMESTPTAEEADFKYRTFNELDRDDYDCAGCGCGPWYGGSYYRELRRTSLPGYGSPPGNVYGPGGYAGRYAGNGREYVKPLPLAGSVVPPMGLIRDVYVTEETGPMVSMDAVPSGMVITSNPFAVEEYPYRRRPNVVANTAMW
jgi:hypothetical protein